MYWGTSQMEWISSDNSSMETEYMWAGTTWFTKRTMSRIIREKSYNVLKIYWSSLGVISLRSYHLIFQLFIILVNYKKRSIHHILNIVSRLCGVSYWWWCRRIFESSTSVNIILGDIDGLTEDMMVPYSRNVYPVDSTTYWMTELVS